MIHRIIDAFVRRCGVRSSALLRVVVFMTGAFVFLSGGAAAFGASVAVVAPSAPLMDAASSEAQLLGRVSQGAVLVPTGRKSGDWIEVQAPSEVSGWVYGELVREGVIAASSVKVRSGPGIGYASLGTLTKGVPVVRRGSRGDWFEIEGQPLLMVWVERAMVAERSSAEYTEATRGTPPVVVAVQPVMPSVGALPEQGNTVVPGPAVASQKAETPQAAAVPLPAVPLPAVPLPAVQRPDEQRVVARSVEPPAVAPLAVVPTPYAPQAVVAKPVSPPAVSPVRSFSSSPAVVAVRETKPPSVSPALPVPPPPAVSRVRSFSSSPAVVSVRETKPPSVSPSQPVPPPPAVSRVRSFSSSPAVVSVRETKPPSVSPSQPVPSRPAVSPARASAVPVPVRSSGSDTRSVQNVPRRQSESPARVTSPAGLRLISSAPQGESITVTGVLRPAGVSLSSGADYRLVNTGGRGPSRTLCYVTGDDAAFEERIGRAVTVEGRKYWVYGSREPIILVRSIR